MSITPGPWRRRDAATHAEIVAPDGRIVAMVGSSENVPVIAASPLLLEALDSAVKIIKRYVPEDAMGFDVGQNGVEYSCRDEAIHHFEQALSAARPNEE